MAGAALEQNELHTVSPEQLCIGLYVHLDMGWMSHPFTFNNFKIESDEQIELIRKLGLESVRYDPFRSDCQPLPPAGRKTAAATETAAAEQPSAPAKHHFHAERLKQLRQAVNECERKYVAAANTMQHALQDFPGQAKEALQSTETLVVGMVDSVLTESDVLLHAINGKNAKEESYIHPLNVTVLSLMLAKYLDMSADEARQLGMAAVFHDIGKKDIPDRILKKTERLTRAERAFLERHPEIGARMARESGLSEQIASIILQHHEHVDGSGYPQRLKYSAIEPLARVLCIINCYDNLCNPVNAAQAMTPYEALSKLFVSLRSKFDSFILRLLVKCLGVYPPGSIVQLASGEYGIVVSVNPDRPLRPFVLLHAPDMPRSEPLIIDLSDEPDANISHCLRPAELPADAFGYLEPRKRISYFFDKDVPAWH